jgi:hypothetical protein
MSASLTKLPRPPSQYAERFLTHTASQHGVTHRDLAQSAAAGGMGFGRYYFPSSLGVIFGAPILSIAGCIFSEVDGVWPVVSGEGVLAFGMVAAGGRSGVVLCGCVSRFEPVGAPELSGCRGVCFWASPAPEPTSSSAAAAEITNCVLMGAPSIPWVSRATSLAWSGFLRGELHRQ